MLQCNTKCLIERPYATTEGLRTFNLTEIPAEKFPSEFRISLSDKFGEMVENSQHRKSDGESETLTEVSPTDSPSDFKREGLYYVRFFSVAVWHHHCKRTRIADCRLWASAVPLVTLQMDIKSSGGCLPYRAWLDQPYWRESNYLLSGGRYRLGVKAPRSWIWKGETACTYAESERWEMLRPLMLIHLQRKATVNRVLYLQGLNAIFHVQTTPVLDHAPG